MNFADINQAWRSPHNQLSPIQVEQTKREFFAMLRRRDRGFTIGISLVFTWLVLITGRFLIFLVWPDPAMDRIDFTQEWAVVLFLALPWIGAIVFVRQHRRRLNQLPDYECTIADSLQALIKQSRLSERRTKSMLWLHLIGVPVLAVCIRQLYEVGKVRPSEVASMIVAMAVAIVIAVGCLTYALFSHRREVRRLEVLLKSYE